MKFMSLLAVPLVLGLAAAAVVAQPSLGAGTGPGPGASAPRTGQNGPGRMGGRWGMSYTPGWSLMTPQERQDHQTRMRSMTNYDECKGYVEQHHEQMSARAKEKGATTLASPRRDACAGLKR